MKVLVAYATHHGATREIAERIAATLAARSFETTVEPVDRVSHPESHDAFIVGSALYCGWLREATDFVRRNQATLSGRPVWLFSSGPVGPATDAQGRDVRQASVPKESAALQQAVHPREHRVFLGAYDPAAKPVGFLERSLRLVPRGANALAAGDFRDWADIEGWAARIADQLSKA